MDCIVGGYDVHNRRWFGLPDWPRNHPEYVDFVRQNQSILDNGTRGDRIRSKRPNESLDFALFRHLADEMTTRLIYVTPDQPVTRLGTSSTHTPQQALCQRCSPAGTPRGMFRGTTSKASLVALPLTHGVVSAVSAVSDA